ncbi:MAG: hypothetical protein FJY82_02635 [Candidatus Aminicenantes bacterium]|nr:hypothetical protein [Candidatus Aminicenantes bacterium]
MFPIPDPGTRGKRRLKPGVLTISLVISLLIGLSYTNSRSAPTRWFRTGQDADLMLSGMDFDTTGGGLLFNHPSGLASDGLRFLLCDRFNNRVLVWLTPPSSWDDYPDLVLGQDSFFTNNPGTSKKGLNFPGNVAAANGMVAVADTENDRVLIWKRFPQQNGQAADVELLLPGFSPASADRYEWPWGVWTDGIKLAVAATHGGALLFWNSLPSFDNQPPDYAIRLPQFGTLRNISSDGFSYFFVSDHNAKIDGNRSGTFFWNSFPSRPDQTYDYFREGWIKGVQLPDGRLIAAGASFLEIWNSLPRTASRPPDLIIRNPYYSNGDGPDVVVAGGRLYANNYNGNNVQVYQTVPARSDEWPDFALGSPSVSANTLEQLNYIQNPVLATNGRSLIATSDFDRKVWMWRSLPSSSGQAPDVKISLKQLDLAPWDNALWKDHLVIAGKKKIAIWNALPWDGEAPARVISDRIGRVSFQELRGVALDDDRFYLADVDGTISVWSSLPETGYEEPILTFKAPGHPLNHLHSDGTYLCAAVQSGSENILVYRVADMKSGVDIKPYRTVGRSQNLPLNLPAEAITFGGSLAIANTNGSAVYLWQDIATAGDPAKAVVLGQPSLADTEPGIGRNRLFWPGSLAVSGHLLWVGEFKFSSRILQFSHEQTKKSVIRR